MAEKGRSESGVTGEGRESETNIKKNGNGGNEFPEPPPPPPVNPNMRVAAVEYTQATQFFNLNGQGTGVAPDNSIPLVTGKTIIFRLYPDVVKYPASFPCRLK